jgi:hypothetical protein
MPPAGRPRRLRRLGSDQLIAEANDHRSTNERRRVTFDVDGLTKAESDACPAWTTTRQPAALGQSGSSVGWPAEWADKVPEPEGCTLGVNGIMTVSPGSLFVACGYPDPQDGPAIVDAYKAKLLAAGFTASGGTGPMSTFQKGSVSVSLMTGSTDWMIISASAR